MFKTCSVPHAFYEKVFAVELQKLECVGLEEMMAFPMQENGTGSMGALVKMDGGPSGGNSTLVYFTCADCAVEATRAKENGGQIFKEKFAIRPPRLFSKTSPNSMILLTISEFWTISHFVEFFMLIYIDFFTELQFIHKNPSKFQPRFIAISGRSGNRPVWIYFHR